MADPTDGASSDGSGEPGPLPTGLLDVGKCHQLLVLRGEVLRLRRRRIPLAAAVVLASIATSVLEFGLVSPAGAVTADPGGSSGVTRAGSLATLRATHDPTGAPHHQEASRLRGMASLGAAPVDTANITVTYSPGFDANARAAFQAAVDIWRREVVSRVPIHIDAQWTPLGPGVLGQAGPVNFRKNFAGAPQAGTYYPDALANALAGRDLDPTRPEIQARFNSAFPSWYKGTNGLPTSNTYDFESVVLHELGHGLGFVGTFDGLTPPNWTDTGRGYWGLTAPGDSPTSFDRFAVDGSARSALNTTTYPNGSTTLGSLLRGGAGGLRFSGPNATSGNGGTAPRLYAPTVFEEGSSVSHLDEQTYPAGSANALMTPYLANNESIHDLGPIVRGMLADIGWTGSAPTTTAAIDAKYAALGGSGGFLGSATSMEFIAENPDGRFVNYRNGAIYWSPSTGAFETHGAIRGKWQGLRSEVGLLGFPTTDERVAADGAGRYNDFQGGSIYWSRSTGAFETHGAIRGKWQGLRSEVGLLGFPTTDERVAADGAGRYNDFQGGSVYWSRATGAWEMHGNIRLRWLALGSVRSVLRYPVTDERGTPDGIGRYNHFQGGSMYYSHASGTHEVHGSIRARWAGLGWERGRLGYPTSDEFSITGGRRSNFQHGYISWNARTGAVTVVYQ